jgi:hypothetical protein
VNDKQNDKEAMEETFTNFTTIPQTIAEIKAVNGDNVKKIPAEVATPFPPLNFSQMGYTCPTKQKKEEIYRANSSENIKTKTENANPLKTSNNNVIIASFLFPVLKTFVAPVLFDPKFLKSIPFTTFVNKKPDGIEPTKYPKMHKNNKFIFNLIFS